MAMIQVKICGVRTPETIQAAINGGANFIGLVFAPGSPRYISPEEASGLVKAIPPGPHITGLFVDPDDDLLNRVTRQVKLDYIQLHGQESPARVTDIKSRFKLPVIKAIPIARPADIEIAAAYESVCDWLLFDAKADGAPSGGHGLAFDWKILAGRKFKKPWMLAGGLTPENIRDALAILSPDAVDVSSGVESARGVKDTEKIAAFLQIVKNIP